MTRTVDLQLAAHLGTAQPGEQHVEQRGQIAPEHAYQQLHGLRRQEPVQGRIGRALALQPVLDQPRYLGADLVAVEGRQQGAGDQCGELLAADQLVQAPRREVIHQALQPGCAPRR